VNLDFRTVLNGVSQLSGFDRDKIPDWLFAQVRDLSNFRLGVIWRAALWPDLLRRQELINTENEIAFDPDGDFVGAYSEKPMGTSGKLLDAVVERTDSGSLLRLPSQYDKDFVHVVTRKQCPTLTGSVWQADRFGGYAEGSQAYLDGYFYRCKVDGSSNHPTNTTDWELIEIPDRFSAYLIRSIYADTLKADGRDQLASVEESNAEGLIALEAQSVFNRQLVRRPKVRTY
tara:strand:+ start:544 stop:1233 length:690 start_codon:yes stop_codon:yes gene_type:complete